MKKYKEVKAWAVMFTGEIPTEYISDFIFDTKEVAILFAGKKEADIVPVIIKQVNK